MFALARKGGKLSAIPHLKFLIEPPPREGFLRREQFKELLASSEALKHRYCGVRLGEAKQIKWSQVDLSACAIRLEGL
jgi:integrase